MNGFAEAIVWMWFLPVTLFIVLPLAMLAGRLVWRMVAPSRARLSEAVGRAGTCSPEMFARAGA